MRIDCSKTINFVREFKRMCDFEWNVEKDCPNCPFRLKYCDEDGLVGLHSVTPESVELVQKWSDEHPQETMAEHFFKMFPNAPKSEAERLFFCPKDIGWIDYCVIDIEPEKCCLKCWNMPYIESVNNK